MAQGTGIDLDISKWEAFIRGLDKESLNEFRKGARQSARELQKEIRADWSGRVLQRRTGRSRQSIRLRIPTVKKLLSGIPIESRVFSQFFKVRLHETGYTMRRKRGGLAIREIPGKHIFEHRTNTHERRHKQIMEATMNALIRKVARTT